MYLFAASIRRFILSRLAWILSSGSIESTLGPVSSSSPLELMFNRNLLYFSQFSDSLLCCYAGTTITKKNGYYQTSGKNKHATSFSCTANMAVSVLGLFMPSKIDKHRYNPAFSYQSLGFNLSSLMWGYYISYVISIHCEIKKKTGVF